MYCKLTFLYSFLQLKASTGLYTKTEGQKNKLAENRRTEVYIWGPEARPALEANRALRDDGRVVARSHQVVDLVEDLRGGETGMLKTRDQTWQRFQLQPITLNLKQPKGSAQANQWSTRQKHLLIKKTKQQHLNSGWLISLSFYIFTTISPYH